MQQHYHAVAHTWTICFGRCTANSAASRCSCLLDCGHVHLLLYLHFIFFRQVCANTYVIALLQVEFEKPAMTVDALIGYGRMLVDEQENVQRVQLAESYLSGAELAGIDGSSMPPELVKKIEERKEADDQKKASPGLLS